MKTVNRINRIAFPASLLCDFYKVSHREQYPTGTQQVYSTWTPRGSRIKGIDKIVMFGLQAFIKEFLIDYFNENFFNRHWVDVQGEYERVIKHTLGVENPDSSHIKALWDYNKLPVLIRAIPEGTLVPIRVPAFTIENTKDEFFWVTNYLETLISNLVWLPMTSATIAFQYRKILQKYAIETVGNADTVPFQGHDFSMRGMAGLDATKASGAAHLLSFVGTDTIPAILYLEEYYNANIETELVGTSIPATEHSVMCANGNEDEREVIRKLMQEIYPTGFFSVVSDTWDFWNIVENVIPSLKNEITSRDGRVVIRPDSGDPVEILCGEDIEDLTRFEKYVKEDGELIYQIKDWVEDILVDKVRSETDHGEHGDHEVEGTFKYKDKYFKAKVEIDWNRYDKQYYFIDGHRVTSIEEITPTAQQLGLIESLWNTFGGTITETGYKLLDTHIGAIYGDSITLERAEEICKRLKAKGFASTNVVLGIGSFTYQYNTRDTFGFAMKATHAVINNEEKFLFKDPKTDNGLKRSQKGRVVVYNNEENGNIEYHDGFTIKEQGWSESIDLLKPVFEDGKLLVDQKLSDIRATLLSNLEA
jgi:nicotinamide phosphoribosyltransferase